MTSDDALRRSALDLLVGHSTMTLAVSDRDGPWAAAVYFVSDEFRLYFLSDPRSRHALALNGFPRAAATVHGETWDWQEIRGLQIAGRVAAVVHAEERRRARRLYLEKFPFARPLLAQVSGVRWFRLDPDRIVSIDNSRGFGDRREVPGVGGSPPSGLLG